MADSKISGMTAASALTGAEVLPVVQSAANVKATTQQVVDAAMTTGLTRQALGSINTNTTIDWSAGSYATATIAGALTFTFSNPAPTGKACVAYLQLTNGGSAVITWPVSVTWSGGTAPTLSASGVDLLRFYTQDNGTTWFGTAEIDEQQFAASAITSGTFATARLGSGTADSTTFLRGDQTWAAVSGGSGDVVGPASSTDNAVARFDFTTGKLLQNTSNVTIADTGAMTITPDANATALTVASHTQTANAPVLDLAQTWNNAAVAFTAEKTNVTNTASAAASLLRDWQVGGVSKASIRIDGMINAPGGVYSAGSISGGGAVGYFSGAGFSGGNWRWRGLTTGALQTISTGSFSWSSSASDCSSGIDVSLFRDAAGVIAQRVGTTAQTSRVYGTYTDASNYVRASLAATSTAVTLAAETAGTGADDVPVVLSPAGVAQVEIGNGVQFTEMTAPSAPAANKVILFAQDNGAGKTQLMALFPTGAAQQVAIEP